MIKKLLLGVLLASVVIAFGCGEQQQAPEKEVTKPDANEEEIYDVVCSFAPSQSAVVNHMSSISGGSAVTTAVLGKALGLYVVEHSSGAYILSGSGGYIAGTLGTAITGPVIVGVGVVVGGSAATLELLCAPKNHPEFVEKVEAGAKEFFERSKDLVSETTSATKSVVETQKVSIIKKGTVAIEYAKRKSVEVSDAVRTLTK